MWGPRPWHIEWRNRSREQMLWCSSRAEALDEAMQVCEDYVTVPARTSGLCGKEKAQRLSVAMVVPVYGIILALLRSCWMTKRWSTTCASRARVAVAPDGHSSPRTDSTEVAACESIRDIHAKYAGAFAVAGCRLTPCPTLPEFRPSLLQGPIGRRHRLIVPQATARLSLIEAIRDACHHLVLTKVQRGPDQQRGLIVEQVVQI